MAPQAALAEYDRFNPLSGDPEIVALIQAGENHRLEFKQSVRWDINGAKEGEKACWKTVAAFLNTDGGDLLLGVHDGGQPTGIQVDIDTLRSKPNLDGYLIYLKQMLVNALGAPALDHITVSIHEVGGVQVCRIQVEPSPIPTWAKEGSKRHFFIRAVNTTQSLTEREVEEYIRRHWG